MIAVVLVAVVKGFLFDLCVVSSTSMEKELIPGDFVIINKLAYGPRMPISPIAVPMTHQTIPGLGVPSYSTIMELPYMRAPGYSQPRINDILVFNYPLDVDHPIDHRTYFIKRCAGLPGQTIELQIGRLMVDGEAVKKPALGQQNYRVVVDDNSFTSEILERFDITEGGPTHQRSTLELSLTDSALNGLIEEASVEEIVALYHPPGMGDALTFPFVDALPWNRDNYGPVSVPAAGDSVELTPENLPLYKRIITEYEGHRLELENELVFIDGQPCTKYAIEYNYYFVLGDNRHQSADSRAWGFVPENHLVGKASAIGFSFAHGEGLRWDRFFKGFSE